MDRSPPPFFKQGPSANARVIFFALLSLAIMVVDSQMNTLAGLRQGSEAFDVPGRMPGIGRDFLHPEALFDHVDIVASGITGP